MTSESFIVPAIANDNLCDKAKRVTIAPWPSLQLDAID